MYISYFHNSNEYRDEFTSKVPQRPSFYWFSDRFHDHYGFGIKDSYFYIFVKDPKVESISMRARGGDHGDFNDLYSDFLRYRDNQLLKVERGDQGYTEPPILMSFDKMTPDLIAKYHEDTNEYEILQPEASTGVRFKLYNKPGKKNVWPDGVPFTDVPELVEALPILNEALPFQEPKHVDGKYVYDGWIPMKTERTGTWL